jgi:Pyruvate/2-oxoacid:ferredoxin oxidoreductase delta subunit
MSEIGFEEIADSFIHLESRLLRTHPQQCVRLRHRKAQCTLCADNCPTHAIVWGETTKFDPEKCTGCGICAAVCPTGAFEGASPTNAELLQRIEEIAKATTTVVFACPKVAGKETKSVVRVNCLGRLDESILVGTASNGLQRIELVEKLCHNCPDKIGHQVAGQAIAEANTLLQAFGRASCISFVSQTSAAAEPTISSSSGKIRSAGTILDEDMQRAENPVFQKGTLATRVPLKRQLLLASLKRLGKPTISHVERNTKIWATVNIKESCTGCLMCAFFCPTGALAKIEENGKPGLAFTNAFCTNCRVCLEICYKGAIGLAPRVDLTKVIDRVASVVWLNKQTALPEEKTKRLFQPVK